MKTSKKKKMSGPSVVGKIVNVTMPFKVRKRIFNEYLADAQDGFVSNIDSYLESKCPEYTAQQRFDIKCFIETNLKVIGKPIPSDHVHIPIKHGHVTWTGKNPPSKEQMEAFEKLADFVFNHPEKLAAGSLKTIPETIKKVSKKTKIPEICLSCGQMNSENCDTCQKPYNLE